MPRDPQVLVFVGIKKFVVALDAQTGNEVWRADLAGADFVSVLWDGEMLIASNLGEVFRLDPRNGAVMWRNQLKGLGRGLVTLASSRAALASTGADTALAKRRQEAQAAASS